MKKLILLSSVMFFAFLVNSCDESTINIDPIGDTEAGYFQNETQMNEAVVGIYSKMTYFYGFHSMNWLTGIWMLPDDNLTTEGDEPYESFTPLNGSDPKLTDFYTYAYQLIGRANTMLEKIREKGDESYPAQPELKAYHRGEALFLRSWMNYMLWNVFGTAPLVTERITDIENAYPPNSTGTQLLDTAIADLETAATLLPPSWDDANKGRVTRNAAYALAGKCLVFRGTVNQDNDDFIQALADFNRISGVSLTSNYGDNFSVDHENNEESLFEFQASDNDGGTNPWLDLDGGFPAVGDKSAYYGFFNYLPNWMASTQCYTPTTSFKHAIEPGDPRYTYIMDTTLDAYLNIVKYVRDGALVSGWAGPTGCNVNNTRILRYAEVLLLKAEAIVRSGGSLSEAIGLINQIRQRARFSTENGSEAAVPADLNTSETDPATVLQWIYNEKRVELAFEEGNRWFDLRRRYLGGEIDLTSWHFGSRKSNMDFESYNVNFPLPENEVVQNKDLDQNEGY